MPDSEPASNNSDTIGELERLSRLKEQGTLTEEEFQLLKAEVLSGKSDDGQEPVEDELIAELPGEPTVSEFGELLKRRGLMATADHFNVKLGKVDEIRKRYDLKLPLTPRRKKKKSLKYQFFNSDNAQKVVTGLILGLIILFFLFKRSPVEKESQKSDYVAQTPSTPSRSEEVPTLSQKTIKESVDVMLMYPLVRSAAISQEGRVLSLVVEVNSATNRSKAKELGDGFVRGTKTWANIYQQAEPSPGKEIGSGVYNYLITVVRQDETIIAQGAKAYPATRIRWAD